MIFVIYTALVLVFGVGLGIRLQRWSDARQSFEVGGSQNPDPIR